MVITLNADELPDLIEDSLLGVDVMFDEMSYREMEFALKEVMKAEDNRVAELREVLIGKEKPATDKSNHKGLPPSKLNSSQVAALEKAIAVTGCGVYSRTARYRKNHHVGIRHYPGREG